MGATSFSKEPIQDKTEITWFGWYCIVRDLGFDDEQAVEIAYVLWKAATPDVARL